MGKKKSPGWRMSSFPAMESFLARIDAIDQQLREAQEEQEAQVELERAAIAAAGAESSAVLMPL